MVIETTFTFSSYMYYNFNVYMSDNHQEVLMNVCACMTVILGTCVISGLRLKVITCHSLPGMSNPATIEN